MKKLIVNSGLGACLAILSYCFSYANLQQQETPSASTQDDPDTMQELKDDKDDYEEEEWDVEVSDSYADLFVYWGLTGLQGAPTKMPLKLWRSHILHADLFYNQPIGKSYFMVSFGAGYSNADFMLDKVGSKPGKYYALAHDSNTTKLIEADAILDNGSDVTETMLSVNYLDFILEMRLNASKEEPQESFFMSVGGYMGFKFWPSMRIQYKENKEEKVWINKEDFSLNLFNYGVIGRIGWNRVGLFYNQSFAGLFKSKSGVSKENILPWSAGITLNIF